MLTPKQREWVRSGRARYTKKDTSLKRLKDQKIRDKTKRMLKDLAFLAGALDHSQHKQVFRLEYLEPLAKALHAYTTNEQERSKKDKKAIVCNKELFDVGVVMGNWFLSMARNLVTERYKRLIWETDLRLLPSKKDIDGITTVYYATESAKT